ncbi:hypothetical protein MNB_SUP05-SYMBIONT-5-277 [hydrothermal vent metagenome]|uniref:Uncharacterized protein n=1 Tax=hydrothermal vent metagenome TaxID=652676 RepID=A0A1W1E2L7_9ZZZZ
MQTEQDTRDGARFAPFKGVLKRMISIFELGCKKISKVI